MKSARCSRKIVWIGLLGGLFAGNPASALAQNALALDDLARMSPGQLETLYRQARPAAVPNGRVRGRALVRPGSRLAVPMSRAARVVWQGKIFQPQNSQAVNRFFGLRMIRGQLYQGSSWLDGQPSLILDYQATSRIYEPYRDEIREVAPGLYLGLMYDRRTSPPNLKMFFALQSP